MGLAALSLPAFSAEWSSVRWPTRLSMNGLTPSCPLRKLPTLWRSSQGSRHAITFVAKTFGPLVRWPRWQIFFQAAANEAYWHLAVCSLGQCHAQNPVCHLQWNTPTGLSKIHDRRPINAIFNKPGVHPRWRGNHILVGLGPRRAPASRAAA